jgi:hypothetical protein
MMQLDNPYLILTSGQIKVLVAQSDLGRLRLPDTMCQLWSPESGYAPPKPLQQALKFLYYTEAITPPQPWREPEG